VIFYSLSKPLGATGAILMTKLLHELERTGMRYGLQTMCIGYGQATATIIERVGRQVFHLSLSLFIYLL
jgi:acetyl-CoA C-acetyltransferase